MELPESQDSQDARVEALWKKLDPQGKGEIDLRGLQRGLKKIDHPLKNARDMLADIVKAMDKNGDNIIQYEEFRTFVEHTERELLGLFQSIDRDRNGKLDKSELREAFRKAGLAVPNSKLDQFFAEVDENHDGYISFDEWRNFLLFLPTSTKTPALKAVLSYYSSAVSVNAEGDTSIREGSLEGLGTPPQFLKSLFGAIIKIAEPPSQTSPSHLSAQLSPAALADPASSPRAEVNDKMFDFNQGHFIEGTLGSNYMDPLLKPDPENGNRSLFSTRVASAKALLIEILPDTGYFFAGGVAGAVSRTATAPLDRLKVYLIANVEARQPISAIKQAGTAAAVKNAGRPLVLAFQELWRAGGMRSLFAGNGLNVLKVMPESAIKFGSFEGTKRALAQIEGHGDPNKISSISKFISGGAGGVISQLVVYPIDTLKFRMQCETVSGGLQGNQLILATWKKMIATGGIAAPYRGLTMGLIGIFPYAAIDLGTFEWLKSALARRKAKILGCHEEDAMPGNFATGAIGAFSGAFGASVVYPVNLLRTRLQAQGTVLHPPTYTGIMDVAQRTIKKEGVRGLFKGITPNLLKVVPSVSITYVVYENTKKILSIKHFGVPRYPVFLQTP